jgi:hypothetical protein
MEVVSSTSASSTAHPPPSGTTKWALFTGNTPSSLIETARTVRTGAEWKFSFLHYPAKFYAYYLYLNFRKSFYAPLRRRVQNIFETFL